jgi:flagellar biosynthesis chaperone FliJ
MRRPDAGLEVALEQRRRVLDAAQQRLSERERSVQDAAHHVASAEGRVQKVLDQIAAAQQPGQGQNLAVTLLSDLERLLRWCDEQVGLEQARLAAATAQAETARGELAAAHQHVRALEVVLEARAAERAEAQRRVDLRVADETAARMHRRKSAA